MAKRSRRSSKTTFKATSTSGSSGTAASGGKAKPRSPSDGGLLQRYRSALVVIGVIAVIGIVGVVFLSSASASAYTCETLLQAPPKQSTTSDSGEEMLGFLVEDAGRQHSNGQITYPSCPPTSGDHRAGGALRHDFYGPVAIQVPNDWVHNLEHGYAVIAYKGDPGSDVIDQIRETMDTAPGTDVAQACGLPNKVIAVRFDEMAEPYAILAWDRALLMSEYDADLALRAATQFQDQPQAPERAC